MVFHWFSLANHDFGPVPPHTAALCTPIQEAREPGGGSWQAIFPRFLMFFLTRIWAGQIYFFTFIDFFMLFVFIGFFIFIVFIGFLKIGPKKDFPLGGHREHHLGRQKEYPVGAQREYPLGNPKIMGIQMASLVFLGNS